MKKNNFWNIFISVSVWAIIIILFIVYLWNSMRPHYHTVSMADDTLATEIMERKGMVDWSQLQVDSTGVVRLSKGIDSAYFVALRETILREEIKAGRMMTAEEMSDRITGYYDKLIDVLIALFVIFTVVSYFAIRNMSKKEVRDEAREILQDSNRFKTDVLDVLRGEFDGAYLSHEDYDEQLKTMQEDIASLKNSKEDRTDSRIEDRRETVARKATVTRVVKKAKMQNAEEQKAEH